MSTAASTAAAKPAYDAQRLFLASCVALVTTAMAFSIRSDILPALRTDFGLNNFQVGWISGAALWGFPISMLIAGPLVDVLGMRRLLGVACLFHVVGILLTIFAPVPTPEAAHASPFGPGYFCLYIATLIIGMASGLVEAVINPLCATVYSDNRTHKLNVLHAWWPGGLVVGGLLAVGITEMKLAPTLTWQAKVALALPVAIAYGILILGQEFPATERVASEVSTGDMWKQALRPMLILWLVCMAMTGSTELGTDSWVGSVIKDTVHMQNAILVLVYTAGLMFVLRFFAGPLVHKFSPLGVLTASAVLSAIGLYTLGSANTIFTAFAAATIFGIGKSYFWPTMLGVTAERFPKGGSLLLALMGATGMIATSLLVPYMGKIYDDWGAGAAFRTVAIIPTILVLIFGALFFYYKARGGYKALVLMNGEEVELVGQAGPEGFLAEAEVGTARP